jgi:hypothetical protein
MSAKLKEIIQASFSNPESMNTDKLQELIQETMRFFYQIQGRLNSKEEAIREEAMQEAGELKGLLEEQVAKLCAHLGKTPEEVLTLAEDRKRFNEKEWESLDTAKSEIKTFKQEMKENFEEPTLSLVTKQKKKKPKTWIAG